MNLDFDAARRQMVGQQIRAWAVLDERVLQTLSAVQREAFVAAAYRELAFADTPIPLAHGQQMLTPKTEGKLLQALNPQPDDTALQIGVGSGYLAACLAQLTGKVRAIEIFDDIATAAKDNLQQAAINNIAVEVGDGMQLDVSNQYDVIAVTGSLPIYDQRFERALKIGGRLFVVLGTMPVMQAMKITRVSETNWHSESVFETGLPALINAPRPSAFVF